MRHNNIGAERVRIGKSVEEVAEIAKVSASAVRKWEAGLTNPSGGALVLLAGYFECTPDYLLDLTTERNGKYAPDLVRS